MEFEKFINENEEFVISKEVDKFLKNNAFTFELAKDYTGEYSKLLNWYGHTYKLTINSHQRVYLSKISNGMEGIRVNILDTFDRGYANKSILKRVKMGSPKINVNMMLLKSEEFVNIIKYELGNMNER